MKKVRQRVVFLNRMLMFPDYPTGESQRKIVLRSFSEYPKTMLQVSFETGILRGNICHFVGDWLSENKIQKVGSGICPISKHAAGLYESA